MQKCVRRFDVRFYSLWTASLFNFCLLCDPFLGSIMSFILPVNILGVGDGGHVPPKIRAYMPKQLTLSDTKSTYKYSLQTDINKRGISKK